MKIKVSLNKTVKYAGTWRPANTVFEIDDIHLEELVKEGAVIIESAEIELPTEKEVKEAAQLIEETVEKEEVKEEKPKTEKRKATRKRG